VGVFRGAFHERYHLACEPCLAGWFANGGDATLASYGIDIEDKWLDYTDMVAS